MTMTNHDMAMSPPSSSSSMNGSMMMSNGHKMMMHMTFFWGSKAEILFHHWPGNSTGMYVLALIFVFAMAVLIEWLSHTRFIKPGSNNIAAGLVQTLMHGLRVALAYLVMLALMSFNVGVFLVAIAGHTFAFFFFASRAFHKQGYEKGFHDLPPITC